MNPHQKREIALRYWLQGRGYHRALEAMEFAGRYHTGTRKDGDTPEFDHQISIAHFVRTLSGVRNMEDCLIAALLHDTPEDYGVEKAEIASRFGEAPAHAVWCMTKKFKGVVRAPAEVFESIAFDPIASVVKPADRGHNFRSMVGVFTPEKQMSYVEEGDTYFLPMIKKARRLFPDQEAAYENLKHLLQTQMELVRAMHG